MFRSFVLCVVALVGLGVMAQEADAARLVQKTVVRNGIFPIFRRQPNVVINNVVGGGFRSSAFIGGHGIGFGRRAMIVNNAFTGCALPVAASFRSTIVTNAFLTGFSPVIAPPVILDTTEVNTTQTFNAFRSSSTFSQFSGGVGLGY